MSFTLLIIVITALTSFSAFNNEALFNKLILWPGKMDSPNEYYRFLTSGFIHADWNHLFFNMFTLFFFGRFVEAAFADIGLNQAMFVILYITGTIAASLPSFIKHKNNSYYRSLGASGGVAAVLFAFIYFAPWEKIYIIIFPVPGIIAAVAYLAYSVYMTKKGGTNINHDAHFWGAVYGFIFTLIFAPDHGRVFLERLLHPHF
jgi:membrane associated rhomboid family serine protease